MDHNVLTLEFQRIDFPFSTRCEVRNNVCYYVDNGRGEWAVIINVIAFADLFLQNLEMSILLCNFVGRNRIE